MTFFDEARSIEQMMEVRNMTQAKLAEVLGVSQPYIANKIRLLNFSQNEQKLIEDYGLSERHARALLRLSDSEARKEAIEKIKIGRMNVARTEIMVDCMLEESFAKTLPQVNTGERVTHFEDILETSLATLRRFGIGARAKREIFGDKLYISICIG